MGHFLFFTFTVASEGGGMEGGGGNGRAILITRQAGLIAQNLRRVPQGVLKDIVPFLFDRAIEKTKIDIKDVLDLNGKAVDAINYPDAKRIEFSAPSVDRLQGTREFTTLVLHEFLGISRIDDLSYQVSIPIVDYLEKNPPTVSYRGGYDSIACKEFENGIETGSGASSAFHGTLFGGNGFQWNAYFTSGFLEGSRRLFFRMDGTDEKTHQVVAALEIPAQERLEGSRSFYCWVRYSWDR